MDFAFSEEQEMLRRSARDFLVKECSSKVVRQLMESADPYDTALWAQVGGPVLPRPFFSPMGLAVPALIEAGTEAQKKEVLGAIADGSARASLALTEPSGKWDAGSVMLTAKPSGGAWQLDGVKLFVPDAEAADYMVVAARTRGEGEDGISLFLINGNPAGMTVTSLKTLDMTRRWSEVRFDGVKLDGASLSGEAGKAWPQLKRALEWAPAALCAEMVGGAQKVLETSTEYAKPRHQFGKPIGIYQAVSHKLADM